MNLGIRAHDIESKTLNDLVEQLEEKPFSSIQLALRKSVNEYNVTEESLNVGFAKNVGRIFDKNEIDIAVLGCYINMIHPNESERRKELDFFKAHIRYARDFQASVIGTETGGIYPEIQFTEKNYTEDAYQKVVRSVKELVEEAERHGVIIGIEGGINHPIYSPKMMKRLLDDIDSNNMQVIFDPVNYVYPQDYSTHTQHEIIDDSFDLFGDRITVVHAKDFVVKDKKITVVPLGQGKMDYDYFCKKVIEKKPLIPILLEETKEPYIDSSVKHFKKIYEKYDGGSVL